jgi:hypothetical protein
LDYIRSKPLSTPMSEVSFVTHHHTTLYELININHEQLDYMS